MITSTLRTIPDVRGLSTKQAAIEYVKAGYRVFPIEPGTKDPMSGFYWKDLAFDRVDYVESYWPGDEYGIGLPMALNGLVALDLDHYESIPLDLGVALWNGEETAKQSTDANDQNRNHFVFDTNGVAYSNSTHNFPAQGWGEVRGVGYIVVEPSTHPREDGQYEWKSRTILPLPDQIRAWLVPASESAEAATTEKLAQFFEEHKNNADPQELEGDMDLYRDKIEKVGNRNEALASISGRVFRKALAGRYPAFEAWKRLIEVTNEKGAYEKGRAEGTMARVIGDVLAEDPKKIQDDWGKDMIMTNFTLGEGVPGLPKAPEQDTEEAPVPSSWDPENLDDVLSGDYVPEETAILRRADGICMLYAGKTHSLSGESESGKSWLALIAAHEVLQTGGSVLYLDYESDRKTIVDRLILLGADREVLRSRLSYVHPETAPGSTAATNAAFERLLASGYPLVVIDGVTEALTTFGLGGRDEGDVTYFQAKLPNQFAKKGAAVVLIDHVTKSKDDRGRFSIGSQHKLAGLSGAAYIVEPKTAIRPGHVGQIDIRVAKDRPGWVRQHSGSNRESDRTQPFARVELNSVEDSHTAYAIRLPERLMEDGTLAPWRPTHLMERISQYLDMNPGASATRVNESVSGNTQGKSEAMQFLMSDGFVRREEGARRGWFEFYNERPYRDPESGVGDLSLSGE